MRSKHLLLALFVVIQLLLLFGKNYTKYSLYGPLHLYDAMLLLLSVSSILFIIFKRGKVQVNVPFMLLLVLSIIYLLYSLATELGTISHTIRQYALFAYPIMIWPIILAVRPDKNADLFIRFISWTVYLSLFLQLFNHTYLVITEGPDYRFFGEKNYLNLAQVMGMILSIPYAFVYVKKKKLQIGIIILTLVLLSSIGHASAVLSGLAVVLVFLLKRLPLWLKISTLVVAGAIAFLFYFKNTELSDSNDQYRLIYWSQTLKESVTEKYAVLGSGFGGKYISKATLERLNNEYKNPWMEVRPEEQYLTAMHNSFITTVFHIGLIPVLVLGLLSVYKIILFYIQPISTNKAGYMTKEFLFLSIVGMLVWISFNMILELPHSSLIFWLILFWSFLEFNSTKTFYIGTRK
jgi:hypothetical protein